MRSDAPARSWFCQSAEALAAGQRAGSSLRSPAMPWRSESGAAITRRGRRARSSIAPLGRSRWFAAPLFCSLVILGACVSPGEGPTPPGDQMYYPVGLAVSPGGHTLYVINSDFDLQYNGGTVLALDLDRIRSMIPALWDSTSPGYPCGRLPLNNTTTLYPGVCGAMDLLAPVDGLGSLVASSVAIGAFATDALVISPLHASMATPARLFVPVRGDPSVTWIEIEDDRVAERPMSRRLNCGQTESSARCSSAFRAGEDPSSNPRGAVLPPEPYGIAATDDGYAIVLTHQTTGMLSLVTNPWDGVPTLQYVLGNMPQGAVGTATLPVPRLVSAAGLDYRPGFLATFRFAAEVDVIRYYDDKAAAPARPFLTRSGGVAITVNAGGTDSRGVAVDASARRDCEAQCGDNSSCLSDCTLIPMPFYVANRTPPSLIIGEIRSKLNRTNTSTSIEDSISVFDSVPLRYGPSRVAIGPITDMDGKQRPRVFVSCFDSRTVFVYDPISLREDVEIRTGRGPHALAFDSSQAYLYIGHFTDSYVGVADLDRRHLTYGTIITSIGTPVPPREAK